MGFLYNYGQKFADSALGKKTGSALSWLAQHPKTTGAIKGAATGWGASMVAGAFMEGDQSQLGGIGFGAVLGALSSTARVRGMYSNALKGRAGYPGRYLGRQLGKSAVANAVSQGASPRGMRLLGRQLGTSSWEKFVRGVPIFAGGMIGATVLESNQPY